jgi:hypothetical protein
VKSTFEKIVLTWKKPQLGEKNEVSLNGVKFFVKYLGLISDYR